MVSGRNELEGRRHKRTSGATGYVRAVSFCLLSAVFFIGFFNRFSPATFAAPIAHSLGIQAAALGGLASMHFWVYTLMQIPAGLLVDRYGIQRPVVIGSVATGLGALVLGMAENYAVALAGPALVGFGMSMVFVGVMKNNVVWFEAKRYGLVTGFTMLIAAAGSVVAQAPAAILLDYVSWHSVFIGAGSATLILAALIGLFYREPAPDHGRYAVRHNSPQKQSAIRSVFRSRQIGLIALAIAGTNGTFYAFAGLWAGPLLVNGLSVDRGYAALVVTAALVPYGIGSLIFGQISDALRSRRMLIVLSSTISVISWGVMTLIPWGAGITAWLLYMALGLSSAQVVVSFAAARESVPDVAVGLCIAIINMGVFLTTALVQIVFGALLEWSAEGSPPTFADYQHALVLPFVLSLIGLAAALFVRETFPERQTNRMRVTD